MKSFLVPTDCQDSSIPAMTTAILMGQRIQSRIYFIYYQSKAVIPGRRMINSFKLPMNNSDGAIQELESLILNLYSKLNVKQSDVPFECIIIPDSLNVAIFDHSEKLKIDLFVIGKMVSGKNSMPIVKKSKIPALVIPETYTFKGFSKIALTIDVNEFDNRKSLNFLYLILKLFTAELNCFYILPTDEPLMEAEKKLINIAAEIPLVRDSIKIHIQETAPISKNLMEWIMLHNCDVVVMLPRKWTIWKDLFMYSMTKGMIKSCELPILVLP